MAPIGRTLGLIVVILGGVGGAAWAQGASASGGTTGTAPSVAPGAPLPSGGVPAAGASGGVGTPPADVQGKPGMSTPGANKP